MNPYFAGVAIGLVLLGAFAIMGRGLGASGAFSAAVTSAVALAAPQHANANASYASATRMLAYVAGAAALLAAFAGEPEAPTRTRAEKRDLINAIELAQWIREQRGVHVFDLRSDAAYQEFTVPTATHATLSGLAALALPRTDTVVVYARRRRWCGAGEARPARRWLAARVRPERRHLQLADGRAESDVAGAGHGRAGGGVCARRRAEPLLRWRAASR
jgi:hypothetical protein